MLENVNCCKYNNVFWFFGCSYSIHDKDEDTNAIFQTTQAQRTTQKIDIFFKNNIM